MRGVGRRTAIGALLAALAAALACSFSQPVPRPARYVLAAERSGAPLPGGAGVLEMGRVRVASPFERQRFIYRTAEASFESDFYRQFESPPGVLLREATRAWLAASGLFTAVLDGGGEVAPDWWLEAEVQSLYADLRRGTTPSAVLGVEFRLLDARSRAPAVAFQRRYEESVAAASPQPEALVAAWSELLARVLAALETDLRGAVRR
ncbi:MAG TPA: ABC-type transport auxiliary lipoprotein family protein [Myxococcota bacterium]|nr:ABC-type transport auxiliary lipoprotein family protein [Myxococcota bacterium]